MCTTSVPSLDYSDARLHWQAVYCTPKQQQMGCSEGGGVQEFAWVANHKQGEVVTVAVVGTTLDTCLGRARPWMNECAKGTMGHLTHSINLILGVQDK